MTRVTDPAPRISDDELARLEELARKATPGPWTRDDDEVFDEVFDDWRAATRYVANCDNRPGNAAYIAALSPDVVLRLAAAARSAPAAGLREAAQEVCDWADAHQCKWCLRYAGSLLTSVHEGGCPVGALRAALAAEEVR